MIKDKIRKSYDNIKPDDAQKEKMLKNILTGAAVPAHKKRWIPWAAAACALAAAVLGILFITKTPDLQAQASAAANTAPIHTSAASASAVTAADRVVCRVKLSINPSVEFEIGEDGMIVNVVGLNDDGKALIEGIDFKGMSLENATIMVVNQLILQGYITAAEIQEEINLSLSGNNVTPDTLSVMTDVIKTAAAEQNIAVDVIQDADSNNLQIVLKGEGEPDVWPSIPPEDTKSEDIGLQMEFKMAHGTNSAYVDNVLIHTPEGKTIENLQDFAGTRLNQAALRSIIELLDKGYIKDSQDSKTVRFFFTGKCNGSDIEGVGKLTELLLAEYGMHIRVTANADKKEILLRPDETVTFEAQESKYALRDVLNYMVNKDEADLSPRQVAILKMAYNYREYQRLMEKRYFVIIPDLVGLPEEQSVDMLRKLGIDPVVVREKVPGYDPEKKNGGLPSTTTSAQGVPDDGPLEPRVQTWEFPVVGFGCVFYQDSPPGVPCQTGLSIQINVIVPEDDERPETTDYREDSGIVIREMDVPFDISDYPDTFSLRGAKGFSAMIKEMNATYTIDDKANYTVTIDRNTGWEGTAVITITHKGGFPMSKFFVQDGRIIEHEFLWRRDAPTADDMG